MEAFTDALRGAKPGQELKAEVIYPADYAEPKLAGKTVAYEVEVKAIKKRTLPELDDEFAKEFGDYESWPTLKTGFASTWQTASGAAWKARPRTGCLRPSPSAFRSRFPSRWCRSRLMRAWSADCAPWPPRA